MQLKTLTHDVKRPIIFDGGFGTELSKRGFSNAPVTYNITEPDAVTAIHADYIAAGCDVITANTFGANPVNYPDDCDKLIAAALKNAKSAAKNAKRVYVALDVSPTGLFCPPMGDASFEQLYHTFKQIAIVGEKNGADMAIVETMQDIAEMRAAILAIKENTSLPVICSAVFDTNGRTMTGATALAVISALESLHVDAVGINCGEGFESVDAVIDDFLRYSSKPILLQPNAGLPVTDENGKVSYHMSEGEYAERMAGYAKRGVHFLGGCCGTTPTHIKTMASLAESDGIRTKLVPYKADTISSSWREAVIWGKSPLLISRNIHPSRPEVLEAFSSGSFGKLGDSASDQWEEGANLVSLRVSHVPYDEIDKPMPRDEKVALLTKITKAVQAACPAPLFLYETDEVVLESVLRVCNGRATVYGVMADEADQERLFPVIKKYGANVIGLCGSADDPNAGTDERLVMARRILGKASAMNIRRKYILLDTLSSTSYVEAMKGALTDQERTGVSVDIIRGMERIAAELRVKTVLPVELLTRYFFNNGPQGLAFFGSILRSGLNGCVFDPFNVGLRKVYDNYLKA